MKNGLGSVEFLVIGAIGFLLLFLTFKFVKSVQSLILVCEIKNRKIQPNTIWGLFIPLFQIFLYIYLVLKVIDTVDSDVREKNENLNLSMLRNSGYISAISLFLYLLPFDSLLLTLAPLPLWLFFWFQVVSTKKQLIALKIGQNKSSDTWVA